MKSCPICKQEIFLGEAIVRMGKKEIHPWCAGDRIAELEAENARIQRVHTTWDIWFKGFKDWADLLRDCRIAVRGSDPHLKDRITDALGDDFPRGVYQ